MAQSPGKAITPFLLQGHCHSRPVRAIPVPSERATWRREGQQDFGLDSTPRPGANPHAEVASASAN
jgi:hypothetical protein